jgi:hypothetical protein
MGAAKAFKLGLPDVPAKGGSMSKVIAIVSFRLPQKQTLDQATAAFQATAPKYLSMPGLLRKNYFLTEDGMRAGGIYLWESRQAAERVYTSEWKAFVKGKYGNDPEIVYVDTPVLVDNEQGRISSL